MRHFAEASGGAGWQVDYIPLTDADNTHSFTGEAERALRRHHLDGKSQPTLLNIVLQLLKTRQASTAFPVKILEDDRFYCSLDSFAECGRGRKQLRMEYFYRETRRKTGILMRDGEPIGGSGIKDSDNRKPPDNAVPVPAPTLFESDEIAAEVCALVEAEFFHHYGDLYPLLCCNPRTGTAGSGTIY